MMTPLHASMFERQEDKVETCVCATIHIDAQSEIRRKGAKE